MCVCMWVCVSDTYTYTYVCMYACMYVCMYVCVRMYGYVCMYSVLARMLVCVWGGGECTLITRARSTGIKKQTFSQRQNRMI